MYGRAFFKPNIRDNSMSKKIEYQKILLSVTADSQSVVNTELTKTNLTRIIGIAAFTSNENVVPLNRLGIKIAGREVLPSDYPMRLLYANNSVSPDEKFFASDVINHEIDKTEVEITITDGGVAGLGNAGYDVEVWLKCEKQ